MSLLNKIGVEAWKKHKNSKLDAYQPQLNNPSKLVVDAINEALAQVSASPTTLGALTNVEDIANDSSTEPQILVKEGSVWKVKLADFMRRAVSDVDGIPTETAAQYLARVDLMYRYVGLQVVLKYVGDGGAIEYITYEFAGGITDDHFQPMALANDFLGGIHRIASAESVKTVYDLATNINPGTF